MHNFIKMSSSKKFKPALYFWKVKVKIFYEVYTHLKNGVTVVNLFLKSDQWPGIGDALEPIPFAMWY